MFGAIPNMEGGVSWQFPERSSELTEPCTRGLVGQMLRNRGYRLEIAKYKKDRGLVRVYLYDRSAGPTMVQLGTYQTGDQPDWGSMYDAGMAYHLEMKEPGARDQW